MAAVDTSLPAEPTGAAARLAARHTAPHSLRLYGSWFCPFVQRAWIVLCEKAINHQYVEINPYHKDAEFLRLNPRGLVPTLAVPPDSAGRERAPLAESLVVCEYLEEAFAGTGSPSLLPSDAYARARARLWIDHVATRIVPAFYRLLQHTPEKAYSIADARAQLHTHLRTLVGAMKPAVEADETQSAAAASDSAGGPWFLGRDFSLVDVSLAPWARRLWLIDHYKPGGLAIPAAGAADDDEAWARWRIWAKAINSRQSVLDTSSDDERYLLAYERYAEDTTSSLVGQATRSGQALP